MMRFAVYAGLTALAAGAVFGQSGNALKFEISDVHASAKGGPNLFARILAPRNGRYQIQNANMIDLIGAAYGFSADTIVGGPNWVELDRFDITAKLPAGTEADQVKEMLQSLLDERFHLKVSKETKAVATWVLLPGKQPKVKEADGTGNAGCTMASSGAPEPGRGGNQIMTMSPDGKQSTISIGPGGTVQYTCRNVTMAEFTAGLPGMFGTQLRQAVADQTGLKGKYTFDLKYSIGGFLPFGGNGDERISLAEAIEKQLGLKLEEKPIDKPVLAIQSVNRTPTPNAPNISTALPPLPTAFDVADVKIAGPTGPGPVFPIPRMMPGGRFSCEACGLSLLVQIAFRTLGSSPEGLAGLPPAADGVRVAIAAKMPPEVSSGPGVDLLSASPLIRNLLEDRFQMKWHEEKRQMTAYSLVASKPKLKKADPDSRIFCKRGPAPAGSPPASQVMTCQNATMQVFADQLVNMPNLNWPVLDQTGLEGGWDFSVTFSNLPPALLNGVGRGGPAGQGPDAPAAAADPNGGYSIFEAIERQLGLKLKAEKRDEPVTVIDHIELKPTEN